MWEAKCCRHLGDVQVEVIVSPHELVSLCGLAADGLYSNRLDTLLDSPMSS